MSNIYIGIDPSLTGTGIVAIRDGKVIMADTILSNKDMHPVIRVLDIVLHIDAFLGMISFDYPKSTPFIIGIEGFSYGSKGRSVFNIGYLGFRIREKLLDVIYYTNGYTDIPPTVLKKFATGKGNSPKEVILQQVYKRWGVEFSDNNQADAFVLAKIIEAYSEEVELTDFQKECIKVLRKGD